MANLSIIQKNTRSIAILGSNGKLGSIYLSSYLLKGYAETDTVSLDLEDGTFKESIRKIYKFIENIDIVFNCLGLVGIAKCENYPNLASILNSNLPAELAKFTWKENKKLIHFSSPSVFSGKSAPNFEPDRTDATSVYGRTKAEGDQHVLRNNSDAIIARVNFLGIFKGQENIALKFIKAAHESQPIDGFVDSFFSPTYVKEIPLVIEKILENNNAGLFHLNSPLKISKYEFALKVFELLKSDNKLIKGISLNSESDHYSLNTTLSSIWDFNKYFTNSLEDIASNLITDYFASRAN